MSQGEGEIFFTDLVADLKKCNSKEIPLAPMWYSICNIVIMNRSMINISYIYNSLFTYIRFGKKVIPIYYHSMSKCEISICNFSYCKNSNFKMWKLSNPSDKVIYHTFKRQKIICQIDIIVGLTEIIIRRTISHEIKSQDYFFKSAFYITHSSGPWKTSES